MDFDGVESIVCDAEESDWLDVSYSERNYIEASDQPTAKRKKFNFKLKKPAKAVAIVLLCAVLLAALLFVDGQFAKDVFETAKAAFSASLFNVPEQEVAKAAVGIPSNLDLVDVADGVATFGGGKAALSFADGIVTEVGENSVVVSLNDATSVVYGNLTDIFVDVGDVVSANALLAKYDGTFTVTVMVDGVAVSDVVSDQTQLTWNV